MVIFSKTIFAVIRCFLVVFFYSLVTDTECQTLPSAPQLIGPGNDTAPGPLLTSSSQIFRWNAVAGATSYRVSFRDLTTDVLTTEEVAAPATSVQRELIPGHNYRWNMRAFNGTTSGGFSDTYYFRIEAEEIVPDAPTLVGPGNDTAPGPLLTSSSQIFQWNVVAGATSYRVSFRDLTTDVLTTEEVAAPGTALQRELIAGHDYRWNMRAFNGTTASEFSDTYYFRIEAEEIVPDAPTLVGPGNDTAPGPLLTSSSQIFQWNAVAGATSYRVSFRDLTTDVLTTEEVAAPGTALQRELIAGHDYRWNMRAFNGTTSGGFSDTYYFRIDHEDIVEPGFYLSFPLDGFTHASAPINSVFDHSMQYPYERNGEVVAYTGERGEAVFGGDPITASHPSYMNANGADFILNDNYTAAGTAINLLHYDGHPGIDFRASNGTPLYATAAGVISYPSSIPGLSNAWLYHALAINHDNGYITYYLHCSTHPSSGNAIVPAGAAVRRGDLIGRSGDAGPDDTPPHLHLEVHFGGNPVDPYGWSGQGEDVYGLAVNRNLWIREARIHPADTNEDQSLTFQEIFDFLLAWILDRSIGTFDDAFQGLMVFLSGDGHYEYDPSQGWIAARSSAQQLLAQRQILQMPTGSAVRDLPTNYSPGQEFEVSLTITPPPGTAFYAVEEQLPPDWSATAPAAGSFNPSTRKVQILGIGSEQKVIVYRAQAPLSASGIVTFSGRVVFGNETDSSSVETGGDSQMSIVSGDKPQVITFSPISDVSYGDGPITLVASALSGLPVRFEVVSGSASVNGSGLHVDGAGPITVRAVQDGDDVWLPAQEEQTFTSSKARLIARAEDKTKRQGESNPELTIVYSGFVNADGIGVIDSVPIAQTTATQASPIGEYPITLSGGADENYELQLVSGTLKVTGQIANLPYEGKSGVALGIGRATESAPAQDGGYVIFGTFSGEIDVAGQSLSPNGSEADMYAVKVRADGSVVWVKQYGGISEEEVDSCTQHPQGGWLISGNFEGTGSFGSLTLTSSGGRDAFLARISENGEVLWVRRAGGTKVDYGSQSAVDGTGNCYLLGEFTTSATFSGGSTTLSAAGTRFNLFVAKYSPEGDFQWAKSFGGPEYDTLTVAKADENGNIYFGGTFEIEATFGSYTLTVQGSQSSQDGYVTKLDANGNVVYAKRFGEPAGEQSSDYIDYIALGAGGECYVGGSYNGSVTMEGHTLSNPNTQAAFSGKINAAGTVEWLYGFTTMAVPEQQFYFNRSLALKAVTTADGGVIVGGIFRGKLMFGPTTATSTLIEPFPEHVFLAKFDQAGTPDWALPIETQGGSFLHYLKRGDGNDINLMGRFSSEVRVAGIPAIVPMVEDTVLLVLGPQDPTPPRIAARVEEGILRLSWPISLEDYALECSATLGADWVPIPNSAELLNGEVVFRIELSGAAKFFRLNRLP